MNKIIETSQKNHRPCITNLVLFNTLNATWKVKQLFQAIEVSIYSDWNYVFYAFVSEKASMHNLLVFQREGRRKNWWLSTKEAKDWETEQQPSLNPKLNTQGLRLQISLVKTQSQHTCHSTKTRITY